ncbi:peptidase M20 [Kushneria phosphatilytica]|uniref:M20 family metallopeptidase n=2 Tax=Kushneria phosphatilytica TaxID=657387 RepID=A0A1S1P3H8_9GAMM|nr:peptidase M20 [Kushneria phosphatilytica]QEL12707.1 M20 family metallopeptidase [Kushneria phosphatilytica]
MTACLETLVNIDSHSSDKAGVDRVGEVIESWLVEDGIAVERIRRPEAGDILLATLPGCDDAEQAPILLMGHRDTVFPTGTVVERGYSCQGDTAFGPGVADMKAGLVLNVFVLRALRHCTALPFPVQALFTADEEIGSPDGTAFIRQTAEGARAVFNAEPGRVSGNVVTARKGGASFVIEVTGKAAHSGVSHADGASAIEALARMTTRIHALTDYDSGVTTNIGTISGGTARNAVAPFARAELDTRFVTAEQREHLIAELNAIVGDPGVPGTMARLIPKSEFLPLESVMSEALFARYQCQARIVGFAVEGEFTGGCSDAGTTASLGIPTLCGTGPVGALMHTEDEYCQLDTLVPRAQALALTILDLAER